MIALHESSPLRCPLCHPVQPAACAGIPVAVARLRSGPRPPEGQGLEAILERPVLDDMEVDDLEGLARERLDLLVRAPGEESRRNVAVVCQHSFVPGAAVDAHEEQAAGSQQVPEFRQYRWRL